MHPSLGGVCSVEERTIQRKHVDDGIRWRDWTRAEVLTTVHPQLRRRRAEAAALREARLDGTYREPWDIEPELLRSTQEVLADGLKSFEQTSTEKWPTVRELSPRRAAAKVGEMTAPYEYAAAPPPEKRGRAQQPTAQAGAVFVSIGSVPRRRWWCGSSSGLKSVK